MHWNTTPDFINFKINDKTLKKLQVCDDCFMLVLELPGLHVYSLFFVPGVDLIGEFYKHTFMKNMPPFY
jgi:hypothetical protein